MTFPITAGRRIVVLDLETTGFSTDCVERVLCITNDYLRGQPTAWEMMPIPLKQDQKCHKSRLQ